MLSKRMYHEEHLQRQSDLCASLWNEWYHFKFVLKDEKKAATRRKLWIRCVDEFTTMLEYEVKTNPRYVNIDVEYK